MKVSAFTFIKNGQILGYPFIESINSILSIVDEFIINIGESEDDTLELIQAIDSNKIRIIKSIWNPNMQDRGYVYGQQKMIAQFNCTGDWAFYIEGDEVYDEDDLEKIEKSMKLHLNDSNVEALIFDFYHFYGNTNSILNSPGWYRSEARIIKNSMKTHLNDPNVEALVVNFKHFYGNANSVLDSPGWYRTEARIIKNSIRSYAPDGLFWLVLGSNKKGRYPKAKKTGATCYHYGWVRSEKQMNLKSSKVQKYWGGKSVKINYSQMDQSIIKEFKGSHPKVVQNWLPKEDGVYKVSESYNASLKQKKHQLMIKIENILGLDLSKKHYKLLK